MPLHIGKIFSFLRPTKTKKTRTHKILVIDDDRTTCNLIRSVLSKKGYEVQVALDGQNGLNEVERFKPDVIFLDCLMPDMGGVEVGKRLKENEKTNSIPIIFLTCVDTPQNIIECYDLGAENYLVKPVSPKEMISQIEASLEEIAE